MWTSRNNWNEGQQVRVRQAGSRRDFCCLRPGQEGRIIRWDSSRGRYIVNFGQYTQAVNEWALEAI